MDSVWLLWHLNSVLRLQHLYLHQAWTNANDKMTVKDYIFIYKTLCIHGKILKYKLRRVVNPSKKVLDLNCAVQDLLLEVVDLK